MESRRGGFIERRLLQLALAAGSLVAISAGTAGIITGGAFLRGLEPPVAVDVDSHLRYLSGLLLAIGLAFASCIRDVERKGRRLHLLAAIVFVGGLARFASAGIAGMPSEGHVFGLVMELAVTPAIALWQRSWVRRRGIKET